MFAENLVDSRKHRMEARRALVLPRVAGAHVALAAALFLASVWGLRYITEAPLVYLPQIPVKLIPPPGRGDPPARAGAPEPRPPVRTDLAPLVIPPSDPVLYTEDRDASPVAGGTGVAGGIDGWGDGGGWDPNGVPGGIEVPRPPEPETGPLEIGGDVRTPVRLNALVPVYPEPARKAGRQGVVVLRLTIDREGRVADVRVVSGLPFGLTQAAVEAARALRFSPAVRISTGRAVECYFNLSVEFRIN